MAGAGRARLYNRALHGVVCIKEKTALDQMSVVFVFVFAKESHELEDRPLRVVPLLAENQSPLRALVLWSSGSRALGIESINARAQRCSYSYRSVLQTTPSTSQVCLVSMSHWTASLSGYHSHDQSLERAVGAH